MRHIITILLILFSTLIYGQTYDWVKNFGGSSFDIPNEMHVDADGNSYLTGWIKDTVNIDGTNYISAGNQDFMLTKIASDGIVDWVFTAGGADNDQGYGVDIDASGNIYVAGSFQGPAIFGATTLNGFGTFDIFVAKFNSSGVLQWVKEFGSTLDDQANQLSVSPNGTIYIGGNCNNGISFGSTMLTTGGFDAFLAKLDSDGNPIWATNGGSSSTDNLYGMDIDDDENIFITGKIGGSPANFGSQNLTNNGDDDIYVVAYDSSGTAIWAVSHGGTDQEQGQGVAVDNDGYVLVTGYFSSSTITIGGNTFNLSGINTMFLGKYNPASGVVMNSYSYPSDAGSSGQNIAVDNNDNIYIAGSFRGTFISGIDTVMSLGNSDGLLLAFDKQMQPLCMTSINSTGFWDIVYGIGTDIDNNVYFSGTYNDNAQINSMTLPSNGAADIFIAKMICDTSGAVGIQGIESMPELMVFPNPAFDYFNVILPETLEGEIRIRLFNILGEEIIQSRIRFMPNENKEISITTEGISAGIYYLNIEDENGYKSNGSLVIR